jgi:glycosyltransferase involved in cell wall biosynthesis
LIHHAGQGGTERYVHTLAQRYKQSGRAVPFFVFTEEGVLARRMRDLGAVTVQMPLSSRYSLGAARRLAAFCKQHDIDVIHTQFLRENYIALLSKSFYPKPRVIYTNHLILANNLITRVSNAAMSRRQDAVIAVCNPGKAQMIKNRIPERLITVIHNGVDPAEWQSGGGAAVRKEANVPDGVPAILYAARFVPGKGHDFLLKALSLVANDHPFHLLLAGEGELRGDIQTLSENLGLAERVTFLGFREDMPAVLAAADLGVNSAGTEACSFNILEAMAAGLPQAVADAGGNGDLISGENGLLFEYGDADSMAYALSRLLGDAELRMRCAQRAREDVDGPFNINTMLDRTYKIYMGEMQNGNK